MPMFGRRRGVVHRRELIIPYLSEEASRALLHVFGRRRGVERMLCSVAEEVSCMGADSFCYFQAKL